MELYNDYNSYLKKRHGSKVYRIALDAGFSCPNRNSTSDSSGCIYCNEDGSRASYTEQLLPVREQMKNRMEYLKSSKKASKFIAYFQAFTNTHSSVEKLKILYDEALAFSGVVGLSIGTRPDCIDREKANLISSYKEQYETWIEYGLQSSHDRTLQFLNRGHKFEDFLKALELTKQYGINISCHVILGLPGETREDIIETAKRLSCLGIDGIKIHLLHILKGSRMEEMYNRGEINVLEQDYYVSLVCDFLEHLSHKILIQRLTGEGAKEKHIAPLWALDKLNTINKIKKEMTKRGSWQGKAVGKEKIIF